MADSKEPSEEQDRAMLEQVLLIQKFNAEVKKKFGVPAFLVMPQSEVGLGGAPLAPVPEGMDAIVDVVNDRVSYVPHSSWPPFSEALKAQMRESGNPGAAAAAAAAASAASTDPSTPAGPDQNPTSQSSGQSQST